MSQECVEAVAKLKAHALKAEKMLHRHRNTITSSGWFQRKCRQAFVDVDIDKNGHVDLKETYIAVLLFYSKLSTAVKGLIPPKIDDVKAIIEVVAANDESITEDEFVTLIVVLLEHLVKRVVLQIALAFMVTPLIAAYAWDLYSHFYVKGTFLAILFPRPIGVNLFAAIAVSTFVPFALALFELDSKEFIESSAAHHTEEET